MIYCSEMALLILPDPNQWRAVVNPCNDVVAWQPWWQVLYTGFVADYSNSVSIWPRGNCTSYLLSNSQQMFASHQQIWPDLCIEWTLIQYNLLTVIWECEDNKLVILLPRPGCSFSSHNLHLQLFYSLFTSLCFFTLFCCWLAPFFLLLFPLIPSPPFLFHPSPPSPPTPLPFFSLFGFFFLSPFPPLPPPPPPAA